MRPSPLEAAPPSAAGRPPIAFLGLGAMGRPMAGRLASLGFPIRVYNRSPGPVRSLAKLGAIPTRTPAECALGASIVLTMVSDAEALAAILEGSEGVLATFAREKTRPRPVLVDMSTIGRPAAQRVAERVRAAGAHFVDAPVSGSVGPAARGDLLALVGGQVRAVERARPVLASLCKRVVHAGAAGQGQALKTILNGVGAHHFVAFASMLALGERAGLARDILLEAFTTGAFASPSYVGKRDKVLVRDYTPEFSLALALKDCQLAAALQEEVGLPLPVHAAIVREVTAAVREGLGELDLFGIEKHYAAP